MPKQHRLTKLRIQEVSSVDSGANKLADIMFFKRAEREDGDYPSSIRKRTFSTKEREHLASTGAAMPGGGYPIEDETDLKNAIRAIGRAKDPAKTKAHIRSRAKSLGLTDLIPDTWSKRDSGVAVLKFLATVDKALELVAKGYGDGEACDFDEAQEKAEQSETAMDLMNEVNEAVCALSSAIWSINGDDTIADKGEAIQESLNQFGEHVKTIVPEGIENALVAESLSQAGYAITPQGGITLSKGDSSMSLKTIAKKLGLEDSASEAAVLAKFEEVLGAASFNANVVKMSGKHKAFMDGGGKMPKGGKEAYAAMDAGERDDHIKANPLDDEEDDVEKMVRKGDAFRTPEGVLITKKEAGSMFSVLKSQNDRITKAEKEAAEAKDENEKAKRTEKAEKGLTLIGKADELGGLLFRISKFDPKLADEVEAVLSGANEVMKRSEVFREFGNGGRGTDDASLAVQKGAELIMSKEGDKFGTIEKARVEFRKRNPEIAKKEQRDREAAAAARRRVN